VRFVVFGAGAIGGVIGARLLQHGHDVVLIARSDHFTAINERGLRLESPDETVTLRIPVVDQVSRLTFSDDDVVLLTMKTQDTSDAVAALAAVAPAQTPVVCAQNGVANETFALRLFPRVYGVSVMCPAGYLQPGVVQAYSAPVTGILDVGRFPGGPDDVGCAIAAAFRSASFESEPREDILRRKYGKLLGNLGNAIEAVCGPGTRGGPIDDLAKREGEACLRAAAIDCLVDRDPDRLRRIRPRPIGSRRRPGGSSWQSLQRRAGTIETDYLNGEIVLLGRLHGVPTPVNELLQQLANRMARERRPPALMSGEEFLAAVSRKPGSG
jgi:2-dehydropantoate 2-reductase